MDTYYMDPVTQGNNMDPPFTVTLYTVLFLSLYLLHSYTNTELQHSPWPLCILMTFQIVTAVMVSSDEM